MAKQADVFPITSKPFELPEREQKLILAHMPPLPRTLTPAARAKVAKAIEAHLNAVEALTAFLDAVDGDTDAEPELGSVGSGSVYATQRRWANGARDDREEDAGDDVERDDDIELDECDKEGIAAAFVEDQAMWSAGRAF
jgi:hypothetical protein